MIQAGFQMILARRATIRWMEKSGEDQEPKSLPPPDILASSGAEGSLRLDSSQREVRLDPPRFKLGPGDKKQQERQQEQRPFLGLSPREERALKRALLPLLDRMTPRKVTTPEENSGPRSFLSALTTSKERPFNVERERHELAFIKFWKKVRKEERLSDFFTLHRPTKLFFSFYLRRSRQVLEL